PYCHFFDDFNTIWVQTSENDKTLHTVSQITEQLLEKGAHRGSFIVGVGGGITTDITGFVASTYKRGVKFGFIPTTLLAQVDASIGGKNGVNFNSYKNIIGTITQPEWIYISPQMLSTLNPREFRAGIAEVLKTFILFDKEYYKIAAGYFYELQQILKEHDTYAPCGVFHKLPLLTDIIGKCAEYKCGVVERDEFERGERRLLNLGHTFAHAIEKICGEVSESENGTMGIMHGEAVSIGMVLAAKLGVKMGLAKEEFAQMLEADLKRLGLPVGVPCNPATGRQIPMDEMIEALKKDKKASGEYINFIVPQDLGMVKDMKILIKDLEEFAGDLC
ncbi:MAG: 3-dehydroquinate synthase, partial [Bacteroidales bacterium]|nr:3-dehydroquinate synthase [Bacteroidales bacterium]